MRGGDARASPREYRQFRKIVIEQAMPRAIVCSQLGPPESLRIAAQPRAALGDGEVRIAVRAAGLNFPDVLMIQDKYQFRPALPFSPGSHTGIALVRHHLRFPQIYIGRPHTAPTRRHTPPKIVPPEPYRSFRKDPMDKRLEECPGCSGFRCSGRSASSRCPGAELHAIAKTSVPLRRASNSAWKFTS